MRPLGRPLQLCVHEPFADDLIDGRYHEPEPVAALLACAPPDFVMPSSHQIRYTSVSITIPYLFATLVLLNMFSLEYEEK